MKFIQLSPSFRSIFQRKITMFQAIILAYVIQVNFKLFLVQNPESQDTLKYLFSPNIMLH